MSDYETGSYFARYLLDIYRNFLKRRENRRKSRGNVREKITNYKLSQKLQKALKI